MPKIASRRLSYTDYFPTIRRTKNFEWKREWITVLPNYITLFLPLKSGKPVSISCMHYEAKLDRLRIGHTRLTREHLMLRNDQQPTCRSVTWGDWQLNITYMNVLNGRIAEKNIIPKVKKMLFGINCENLLYLSRKQNFKGNTAINGK